MKKKYFVISNDETGIHKVPLMKWWRYYEKDAVLKNTRSIFFELVVNRDWKWENLENEVILISSDFYNDQHDTVLRLDQSSFKRQSEIDEFGHQTIISEEFGAFIKSYKKLKEFGLLRNQKDITGQLGEWLASEILGAEISLKGNNEDWDLAKKENGKKIHYQVKSHAKSDSTKARWTRLEYSSKAKIDFFIIVVFSQDYALREFYEVPFLDAIESRTDGFVLNWSKIKEHNKIEKYRNVLINKNLGFILEKKLH
jgi:hypothetical protein